MHHILENIFLSKELYHTILAPICAKYNMTHAEMVTLLFLAGNPKLDTATDVVRARRLTKSAVSMAVKSLQEKGLVCGEFTDGNHRSVHLKVCNKAEPVVKEGQTAQNAFLSILTDGFSEAEKDNLRNYFERVSTNIKTYHKVKL